MTASTYVKTRPRPSYYGFLSAGQRRDIRRAVLNQPLGNIPCEVRRQALRYGLDKRYILRALPKEGEEEIIRDVIP